jgi:hypothetical protein
MLQCFAARDNRAPQIGVEDLVELVVGRLLEQGEREHARIVDDDVERPERCDCFGTQMLHLGDIGDIRLNRARVAACGPDTGDDRSAPGRSVAKFTTTEAPAAAIAFAMPAPMPLAAPVTSATLPVKERVIGVPARTRFGVR